MLGFVQLVNVILDFVTKIYILYQGKERPAKTKLMLATLPSVDF